MNLVTLSQTQKEQYNKFVAAQGGSFLQSWNWGEFQAKLGQKVFRFGLDDNRLAITAQFIEQTIPHLGGKYLYCPYGPVGNPELLPQLISELKKQFPEYWFMRIESQKEFPNVGQTTLRIQPGKTLITDLTKTEEELLAGMHNKTRYNIRVAQKHNVSVEKVSDHERIKIALNLITETSSRQGFTDHPASYYQKLVTDFPEAQVYVASYGNKVLNCAIMVDHNDTRTYLFGGSGSEHRNVMAPYLLHWQAIRDAKTDGKKRYDWWGVETATGKAPGFARFKLGWPGEQVSYPAPVDTINKPVHYAAYKILRSLNRLF